LSEFTGNDELVQLKDFPLLLLFEREESNEALLFQKDNVAVRRFHITSGTEWGRVGSSSVSVRQKSDGQTIIIRFTDPNDIHMFQIQIEEIQETDHDLEQARCLIKRDEKRRGIRRCWACGSSCHMMTHCPLKKRQKKKTAETKVPKKSFQFGEAPGFKFKYNLNFF